MPKSFTALASPNIALIKYWGNRDNRLNLPANSSLSFNLAELTTQTTIEIIPGGQRDELVLNDKPATREMLGRVSLFLDLLRELSGKPWRCQVTSQNNFSIGAGIASSASAFAALAVAGAQAFELELTETQLSRLARRGSGSACRSIPPGFVIWQAGNQDANSSAYSIASPDHWPLSDCIAVVSQAAKTTGSTTGHALAATSPLQAARLAGSDDRLRLCRKAILERDFEALAAVCEQDSNLMHAVMITSTPPLFYWMPGTLMIMQQISTWRNQGIPVFYTVDAGPNVHTICLQSHENQVLQKLSRLPGVEQVLLAHPGDGAKLI